MGGDWTLSESRNDNKIEARLNQIIVTGNIMVEIFNRPRVRLVGDAALMVEYGDVIAPEINRRVRVMAAALELNPLDGVVEIMPTYRSLMVNYDPLKTRPAVIEDRLLELADKLDSIDVPPPQTVDIPVCYGGEFGPDIDFVARHTGLSVDRVVARHSSVAYQIYMIGFTPGFPYLGGLPEELAAPRLETPRTKVAAGTVGIANNQTGVYSVDSPGGWRLIGRTPLRLFKPEAEEPFLYRAGDLLRFRPIDRAEYDRLARGGKQ